MLLTVPCPPLLPLCRVHAALRQSMWAAMQMLQDIARENAEGDEAGPSPAPKKKRKKKHQDQDEAAAPATAKKAKATKASADSSGSKAKAATELDPKVQKLKRICQQAGIAVGPSIWKHADRIGAFTELLHKHNLSSKSCTVASVVHL